MTAQPAPSALAMPVGESSMTTHRRGSTPTAAAAATYGAGSGLVRGPPRHHTSTASKFSAPIVRSATLTRPAACSSRARSQPRPPARWRAAPGRRASTPDPRRTDRASARRARPGRAPGRATAARGRRGQVAIVSCVGGADHRQPAGVGELSAVAGGQLPQADVPDLLAVDERAVHVEKDSPELLVDHGQSLPLPRRRKGFANSHLQILFASVRWVQVTETFRLTDERALAALAHPLRMRLLAAAAGRRAGHRDAAGRAGARVERRDLLPPAQARRRRPGRGGPRAGHAAGAVVASAA